MSEAWKNRLKRIDEYRWEIPTSYKPGMRVPGLIFADDELMSGIAEDQAVEQVANVATLPGIVGHSLAMPDIHWGYGFPIGGVAATRVEDGVISPGGIGFDINCGVRLLRTEMSADEVCPRIGELARALFQSVPSGVGSTSPLQLHPDEIDTVLRQGARWAVGRGMGEADDLEFIEEHGALAGADPDQVSDRAKQRGFHQLGTLGAGNHFLEVQVIDEVYRPREAAVFGLQHVGTVLVLIHTGSRGFGHQVCDDYLHVMGEAVRHYDIELPDRQLACAPFKSSEGQAYYAAMACAANFAWANRQCITHWVRQSFIDVFQKSPRDLGADVVYDVAHNIAKVEEYRIAGKKVECVVHRKGATRAFPPGHPAIPPKYMAVGQPVLIPGDMGRYSFVAVGTERAMEESFGSTCHGAGRQMSRGAAKRALRSKDVAEALAARGITVMATDRGLLAEEAPDAYKDVADVVRVVDGAGLSLKVARMRPLAVVKG